MRNCSFKHSAGMLSVVASLLGGHAFGYDLNEFNDASSVFAKADFLSTGKRVLDYSFNPNCGDLAALLWSNGGGAHNYRSSYTYDEFDVNKQSWPLSRFTEARREYYKDSVRRQCRSYLRRR